MLHPIPRHSTACCKVTTALQVTSEGAMERLRPILSIGVSFSVFGLVERRALSFQLGPKVRNNETHTGHNPNQNFHGSKTSILNRRCKLTYTGAFGAARAIQWCVHESVVMIRWAAISGNACIRKLLTLLQLVDFRSWFRVRDTTKRHPLKCIPKGRRPLYRMPLSTRVESLHIQLRRLKCLHLWLAIRGHKKHI